MQFSRFKILVVFAILTLIGTILLFNLSLQLNPTPKCNSLSVSFSCSGASSYSVENQVTSILESGFGVLQGVKSIRSKSTKGGGVIFLELEEDSSVESLRFEVATVVKRLYAKLPETVSYPLVMVNQADVDLSDNVLLVYTFYGAISESNLQEYALHTLGSKISGIDGVDKIAVDGANPQEWLITYNPDRLNLLKISRNDIVKTIRQYCQNADLGLINANNQVISVVIDNNDFFNFHLPIQNMDGKIVFLDEITDVKHQVQKSQRYFRVNGNPGITLSVYADNNVNTINLSKEIDLTVKNVQSHISDPIKAVKLYDTTDYLKEELDKIYIRSAFTFLFLCLFLLLINRSIKFLVLVISTVFVVIAIASIFYYYLKIEIQLYSLNGVIISLGLLVNSVVVVLFNKDYKDIKKVFLPLLGSAITTVGAFCVICFSDYNYDSKLVDFAKVVIVNLSVSLFTALFFVPALMECLSFQSKATISRKFIEAFFAFQKVVVLKMLNYKRGVVLVVILVFGIPIFMLPNKLENNDCWYGKIYNSTIGSEWFNANLRTYLDSALGGTFRLFSVYVFENDPNQDNDETKLYVVGAMDKGATIQQMNSVCIELEDFLKTFPEIKQYVTEVNSADNAKIEILFEKEHKNSSFPYILKSKIIRKILDYGSVDWQIYGVGNGFSNGGVNENPINFRVQGKGYNYQELTRWTDVLKKKLETHYRVKNILITDDNVYQKKKSYEYRLKLDKEKMMLYQTNSMEMFESISERVLSETASLEISYNGKNEMIRVESENASHYNLWDIKNNNMYTDSNFVNLRNVASVTKEIESESIKKENQEYVRTLSFQYAGSAVSGEAFLNQKIKKVSDAMPMGYRFEKESDFWSFGKDKNSYFSLFLLIVVVVYFMCAILFEDLKQPLVILSIIPIVFVGVFATFYLFDFHFDQGGLIAFILLSGLTVNASIFIVNDFNFYKKEGFSSSDAFFIAYKNKIKIIFTTVVASVFGFLPFVFQSDNEPFWSALAVGSISGLLFSLLAVSFFLPIFCIKKQNYTTNT